MLNCLTDTDIARLIEEDLPYGDLTTHLLGIGSLNGKITFSTRENTTVCCTEEAARLLEQCGCNISGYLASGTACKPGTEILSASGTAQALHAGWKASLNLLEYASGIASRTRRIVDAAKVVNPQISIVTTRKSFPGTKKISIKAVYAGGALPHRLGLSESVLVFRQHTAFMGGLDAFLKEVETIRLKALENKIIVEAETVEEALAIARHPVDVIQLDKIAPVELARLVLEIRSINPMVKISAAGGINEANAAEYAASGVDIIVLSSVYFGKPADIGATITPVEKHS